MTEKIIKVQEVRSLPSGALVGFALKSIAGDTFLAFADQQAMPGFRLGDSFVASVGEQLECTTVFER